MPGSYFKKSEDFQGHGDAGYHGYGGPQTVSDSSFITPAARAFVEAGKDIGYKYKYPRDEIWSM